MPAETAAEKAAGLTPDTPTAMNWLPFVKNGNVAEIYKSAEDDAADSFTLTKAQRADAEHATDFDVPLYSVWTQPPNDPARKKV